MRVLTIAAGVMLAVLGIFSIASSGLSFISLAFPIGLIMIISGIIECFAFRKAVDDEEDKHWILIEGLTTFLLGIVVISGQLAADIAVVPVFGLWSAISGIRGLVVALSMSETKEEKDVNYYWDMITAVLAAVFGVYAFFNSYLFNAAVLTLVGLIIVVQAAVVIKISFSIAYKKPHLIKSKAEKIKAAEEEVEKAKEEMRQAIMNVREVKSALKEVEEEKEFHEIIAEPVPVEPINIAVEPVETEEPEAAEPEKE